MTGRTWKRLLGTAASTTAAVAALGLTAPQATAATATESHTPHPAATTTPTSTAGTTGSGDVDYGTWIRDVQAVIDEARPYIEERSADAHQEKQAIVFDVDNTTLETDLGFSLPQHAVYPSLELAQYAHSRGVDIFFVTARPSILKPISRHNLEQVGYPVEGLYVRHLPDLFDGKADYKSAKRAEIEAQGYNIIANIGNTPTDIQGGHAERHIKLPHYDGQLS